MCMVKTDVKFLDLTLKYFNKTKVKTNFENQYQKVIKV